jgi:glycolate oxidase iron-sulfur subunit
MLKDVPVVRDLIKRCLRCGLCRQVCPVFNETKREDDSPRGKVFYVELLRNNELDTDANMDKKLFNCLLCGSCRDICPSSIPVDEIITAARAESAKTNSHSVKRWIYNRVWTDPDRLRMLVKSIGMSQRLGLVGLGRAAGITQLLPGDMPKAEKMMGKVPARSARQQLPAVSPAIGLTKYRVVYFLGCGTDLLYPEVALATV